MADSRRRPWTDADTTNLIDLWPRMGSIVLIALHLERSTSSVQTQASRVGLPRRREGNERHRRKWSAEDNKKLVNALEKHTDDQGRILIIEIAQSIGRSIDAVAAKMSDIFGSEEAFFDMIHVTKMPDYVADKAADPIDRRKMARQRKCLTCQKNFWSEGAHNRICGTCKKSEGASDWDY
ncbi:hypothetical protein [Roseibium sp. RKSG952]|uniref:hypothetical protein n=1 Tax=Roseibium sp. RKSG952 TaxID=2529384 RepID=UPI0012BB7E9A|nr:hypothetical protein [Roseibium sp. RKSG952]MTH96638.1 hypothetical protein [Roseibium sp. RKSG952]